MDDRLTDIEAIIEATPTAERQLVPRGRLHVRTDYQKMRDRAYLTRKYLAGVPLQEIADALSISASTLYADLDAVREQWAEATIRDFNAAVNQELARIDALEQTYWEAWRDTQKRTVRRERTKRDGAVVRMQGAYGPGRQPVNMSQTKVVTETPKTGDFKALEGVRWCIDRRIRLLGLDAPTKIAPTNPDGTEPYDPNATESKLKARLAQFLAPATAGIVDARTAGGVPR